MKDHWDQLPFGVKAMADALSITTLLGTLAGMLPHIAALLTIIWTGIRIYETATVQRWFGKNKPCD